MEVQTYFAGTADVAVVGAGHAGLEAALACARLGHKTLLFTINLDAVGNMPCNPSIGGTGKGHLVYEIDALGGEMGRAADKVTLQSRTLNLGKGPAVHSKRVQADRAQYRQNMKETVEHCQNLSLIQGEITEVRFDQNTVCGVVTHLGAFWQVKAVILCTGTFLNGKVIIGPVSYASGPDGMLAATHLTEQLKTHGIRFLRFKTGTPARIHADSIDYSQLEVQPGETDILPFSADTDPQSLKDATLPCHILYTNATTHQIIRDNLHRSPLYSGMIEGTGPRYCPSIEDKIVRFADKERHQLFLEPMGRQTKELYLQGFSSSLPEEVQMQMLHSLPGMAKAQVMRTAYAIEYDCIDPTQLDATLEFKEFPGLYGAGQFNGTSGYEEAAAQGLVAGINAALKLQGKDPLILTRDCGYIGTLIDDLVTKGTEEPYRIMTSRSEYRLLHRQDNADQRLTAIGAKVGLVSPERLRQVEEKYEAVAKELARLESRGIAACDALNEMLAKYASAPVTGSARLADLLRRPQVTYADLAPFDPERPELSEAVTEEVEIQIKYAGYLARQEKQVENFRREEARLLPENLDYNAIAGLRLEARQKLSDVRPVSIGQAGRISGVSPADIAVLLIWLEQN